MDNDNCILCGQVIFEPLLTEYQENLTKAINLIAEAVKEAYDDTDEGADLFAKGLIERLKYEL